MNRTSVRTTKPELLAGLVLFAVALAPGLAWADTTDCTTIASLPRTISVPGRYCLAATLATASTAAVKIDIKASNVLLDCNENEVAYTGVEGSNGTGVRVSSRSDVIVRNCRFVNFNYGFDVLNGTRVLVLDNHADGSHSIGIRATGSENQISGNSVSNTTGAIGIRVDASADSSAQIRGNTVSGVRPVSGTQATGIRAGGGGRVILRDNVVRDVGSPTSAVSSAILVGSSSALVPSPAVVMNGGLFMGTGAKNYAVQTVGSTSKVVCEGTSYYFYIPPYLPGCL